MSPVYMSIAPPEAPNTVRSVSISDAFEPLVNDKINNTTILFQFSPIFYREWKCQTLVWEIGQLWV